MRQEMQKMEEKIAKEESVIEHYESHILTVEEYYNEVHEIETRVETNVEQQKQIDAAQSKVKSMQMRMASFNEMMQESEKSRMQSEASMNMLQENTRSLFQKSTANAQKISQVEEHCGAKIQALKEELSGVSVRLSVSSKSSRQDLTRMDKSLQKIMTELTQEASARRTGDTKTTLSIMERVQTMVNELQHSVIKSSSSS